VTSDFQQFPKKGIKDSSGELLFHPRRIVLAPHAIAYLDYSQIELRVQAFYTMLVGHPDKNLCRAYMPFDCIERDGKYYLAEDTTKEWQPVDVHAETTKAATGFDESHPEFDILRTVIGKRVNFSKNYGAQLKRVKEMFPDKTDEECQRINDSYYTAFPGVKFYHNYCNDRAARFSNTQSLFGIRYYNVSGHKLKNLLVQGSSAHLLKHKIVEIHNLLRGQGSHIRIQMQIHDELSFEVYDDIGFSFIPKIKALMEDWPDCTVPIVAECEVTYTNWAEKRKEHV
jgi:DNA polymerase-1